MHVSLCKTAALNLTQNRTCLCSALTNGQVICINKTNTSGREVRGVADIIEISIVIKKYSGVKWRAVWDTLLRHK